MRERFPIFLLHLLLLSPVVSADPSAAVELPIIEVGAWAHDAELTLPARQTTLQVVARSAIPIPNPLTYRWVQVAGPPSGNASFSPNGDEHADITTANFTPNVAGTYVIRVIVSDGVSESISEVEVQASINPRRAEAGPTDPKFRAEQIRGRTVHMRVDRVIVRFETDGYEGQVPIPLSAASLAVMDSIGARISKTWLGGRLGRVELSRGGGDRAELDQVLGALTALPEIRRAEADHSLRLDAYGPNDPLFDSQWGLENPTGVDIAASLAWDQTTGSAKTLVAVMDTGTDYTHPDLYLAIAINNGEIPTSLLGQLVDTNSNGLIDFYDLNSLDANGDITLDGQGEKFNQTLVADQNGNGYIDADDLRVPSWMDAIDGDSNAYLDDLTGWDHIIDANDSMDTQGHGTHVTGIIAARGDNGVGVAGVDWRTQILPERFHDADGGGGTVSDAIQAIEHAVLLGANVINASWGTFADSPALKESIQWAGDNGVVVVAAAGNHSNDIDDPSDAYYPAAYSDLPNLISVASVDPDGSLSAFSNFGLTSVDLAGPGASILSTGLGGNYVLWSGTSMATPHVAGTVSLLAGLYPDQSPAWLVNQVLSTVTPLSGLANKVSTGGMLDAYAAVNTPSVAGPRIVMADPIGHVEAPIGQVYLTFDSPMSAQTFATDDVLLAGPSGLIIPTAVNAITDVQFEVLFPLQATAGTYSLHVGPDIEDNLGRAMDQDRDEIAGEPLDDRFHVIFRVLPSPTSWIVDDGDSGYSATGSWSSYVGSGAQGDFSYKPVGSGSEAATWTRGGLVPGEYRVSVTWQPYSNRTDSAPYTVLAGSSELGTVVFDQRVAPADFVESGVTWQDVGTYQLAGDTLSVRLSDAGSPAGSYAVADAVRMERIGDLVSAPEVRVQVAGADVADGTGSVAFGSTAAGSPLTQTFSVANLGSLNLTLGTIALPGGFSLVTGFGATLLAPGATTTFVVQLDAVLEGAHAGVISFDSNDADENPFDFAVSGTVTAPTPPAPEIQVLLAGSDVADGTGFVDLGSTQVGAPVTQTLTVANTGTLDLTLGAITLPSGFSLVADFGTTLLAPGQNTSFVIQLDALVEGTHAGVISFNSNDADENPFDFAVSGTVLAAPSPTWTVDDGDLGYSATSGWSTYSGVGAQGDFSYKQIGSGAETATWTLSGLVPGLYVVSATWEPYSNRPDTAPYTIFDGSTELGTANVDQRVAPADFVENGVFWQDIGVHQITGDTVVVRLSDAAGPPGSYVIADAIRAERIGGLVLAPEVQVQVAGANVADGTGSVDFGSTVVGSPLTRTFTVANAGTLDLALGSITLPSGFSLFAGFGTTLLAPGSNTTFVVQLDAVSEGTQAGAISFDSNDADENPFDFAASGTITAPTPPAPELQVSVSVNDLTDGTGFVAFGSTLVGAPLAQTITVANVGTLDLSLGTITVPSGFSLVANFGTSLLTPGQTTTFAVQLDAVFEGTHAGAISFDSDDADENPFDFNVSGSVAAQPTPIWTLDDGDAGYSASGSWSTYNGVGAQGDFRYKIVGAGTQTATWTLSGLVPGDYVVSVTWQPYTNRADSAPYTVLDGSTELATVLVDQRAAPADFVEDGVSWQDVGIYQLTGDTLVVRLSDNASPSGSYVIADGVRVESLGEVPLAPEIQVLVAGAGLSDGSGSVDFGSTVVGAPLTQTISVGNVGTLDLSLGTIALPSGYSLVTGFGTTLLAPGQTTNFVVQLDAVFEGSHAGVVSFDSNDANENPFDFGVSGSVFQELLPTWTIDDGDPGYSAVGSWNTYNGVGAQGDFSYKAVGSGTQTATWTLSGLLPGQYIVSVTWEPYSNRANNAPYTVLDGSTELGTVAVDQRVAPSDFVEDGVSWQDVGVYQLAGDTLLVRLSDQAAPAGSYVIADAVRVERLGD